MKLLETFAIIVAGGKGLRMGGSTKKQYLKLNNIPVLTKTLLVFDQCEFIHHLILVIPKEDKAYCRQQIVNPYNFSKSILITEGGTKRQDSVFNGLKKVKEQKNLSKDAIVLIHDGVRPFVSKKLIETCIEKAFGYGACIPAIKIEETIKKIDKNNIIQKTVNRTNLYAAQTPQVFQFKLLFGAYKHAQKKIFVGTDDASLVEEVGKKVYVVDGLKENIKITTPQDLFFAEYLCKQKTDRSKEILKKISN